MIRSQHPLRVLAPAVALAAALAAPGGARAQDELAELPRLVAGPIPAYEASGSSGADAFVPELDPETLWPREGRSFSLGAGRATTWSAQPAEATGLEGAHVTYTSAYFDLTAFARVALSAEGAGALRLFVDGAQRAQGVDAVRTEVELATGRHRVLVRGAGAARLRAAVMTEGVSLRARTRPEHAPASYDALRGLDAFASPTLSPDGRIAGWVRTRRDRSGDGARSTLILREVGGEGRVLLQRDGATPLTWDLPGARLLLREGSDLLVWSRLHGTLERLLEDEPGLGEVQWSRDGSFLVFASTRGAPEAADGSEPRRRVELREKLDDWPTRPHLHSFVLESGLRRRLTGTGDHVQDRFALLPDDRTLVFLRNVPIPERPWFETVVLTLDLVTGAERERGRLHTGFEGRAGLDGFALSPDGRSLAFTGPPSELGRHATGGERNAFDPDLWLFDLETGAKVNLTADVRFAAHGPLRWDEHGHGLTFLATDGALQLPQRWSRGVEGASFRPEASMAEVVTDLAVDAAGAARLELGSTRTTPPSVTLRRADGSSLELARADAGLDAPFTTAIPEDASFVKEDGTAIEGWLYRPVDAPSAPDGRWPLIVYYYGGATPSLQGWNELHQFLVAGGFALYVLNPRGASGYGSAFADQHVGDWGPRASADVLEGLQVLLTSNPDLDPQRVGCFGGSFGGFLTMYLLSTTDRFAAGVSLYGISNIASYQGDGMWGYTYGDQALANLFPWTTPDFFVEHSPLFRADRIVDPLLLLHGDQDGNVLVSESEQIFTALCLLGRPVELVRFPGEDHGLRGTWTNRVRHRTMLREWFDRWLRDRPEAWSARW